MPYVKHYQASWNPVEHKGSVRLLWESGTKLYDSITDPAELHAILDLLRNEQPVHFNESGNTLRTRYEPVGEGE
jgi:hypothetical protein